MRALGPSFAARASALAGTRRARRILWWIAGLLGAYAAIGFLGVPPIAKAKLQQGLSRALHREVTVEAVRVNPFAPSVTLRGLRVRERASDAIFASFDELYVNAAWTSLFRLAPVVDRITLAKPALRIVRNADRTYNFQDLLDELQARPKSTAPPPGFAVFNVRVLDGRIDFEDRVAGETHAVEDLRVGIPFVSSLPAHVDVEVAPELSMKVNGSLVSLAGETLPFTGARTTVLNVNLNAFDLTRLTEYLPFEPRAKLRSALLDARLAVAFEQPAGRPPEVRLRGRAALTNVSVLDPAGRPVLAWERLGVELNEVEPLLPRIDLKSVQLAGAEVHLRRDAGGALNLAQLGPAAPAAEKPAPGSAAATGTLALKIDDIAIGMRKLRFSDETTRPAFDAALEDVNLEVRGLDLQGGRSEWALSARSDAGEAFKLKASASVQPPTAQGRLEIGGVVMPRYQPYIDQAANLRLEAGKLDLGLEFQWQDQALKLADVALAVRTLRARLPGEKDELLRIGELQVEQAAADLAARTASLGRIALRDVVVNARRGADGVYNFARVARGAKADEPADAPSGAQPWRVDLPHAVVERGAVTFEDRTFAEPLRVGIAPIEIKAERLSTAKDRRGEVSLRAVLDKTGTVAASGPVSLEPLAARLDLVVQAVGILPVQKYIEDKVHLAITAGTLGAKGVASFEMRPGEPLKASYAGDAGIGDFASIDKRSSEDLLKWKRLSFNAVEFELEPMRLSLGEIALDDYYARVILSADGRLNLQELVATGDAAPATTGPAPSRTSPPAGLRIGRITARAGNVNFSDFFIRPNYTANLTGIGGVVTEMTPEKAGDVELRGSLDNAAPVEITGRVNPLAAELYLDVKGSARDIELSALTPYSVKYAGYGIQRGKLSMNVQYAVEKRKLTAENRITVDQLTFGERVESPTATKLPVTLAIALLKDRNGVIDINLPIAGSLDDPEFSVGGLIVQVLVNLVVKAITSPFALLGSLVGGSEELSFVEFAPGSAALAPPGEAKLKSLAQALLERPNLRLDVGGRATAEPDEAGLRRAALERKVRAQKFGDLRRAGTAPPSVDAVVVAPEEYEGYLRRAYGAEKFPKPRNMLGIAKDLPVPDMESLMLEHARVSDEDLRQLANTRAQAAKDWLVTAGKVPADRVFLVAPKLTAEDIKDKGRPTRVDFGLK